MLIQIGTALLYYAGLVLMTRLAGKRLAGQVATFDLIVLISLGVVLQGALLQKGALNALVFFLTVFFAHRLLAHACVKLPWLRKIVRGAPTVLVRDGDIVYAALRQEGMSEAELMAGLRKVGFQSINDVKLAVLEETGHISAISQSKSV